MKPNKKGIELLFKLIFRHCDQCKGTMITTKIERLNSGRFSVHRECSKCTRWNKDAITIPNYRKLIGEGEE